MVLQPTITNSYSMDIIIKICGTLSTFLIFIFISAWHLTRRKYNLPYFIRENYEVKDLKDLLNFYFLNLCYKESKEKFKSGAVAAPCFNGKTAVIINDINWCFTDKPSHLLSLPFSLTPKCVKESWKGIIYSHDSVEIDVLRCLTIKGFESIDWLVLEKSINFGLRYLDNNEIDAEASSQLIAFESIMGYSVDTENLEKKFVFVTKVAELICQFSDYFYCGKSLNEDLLLSGPFEFVETVNELMRPVVESAIFHTDSQYSNAVPDSVTSENILSQIAKLRHHLREENASCNLLTVENFSHLLFEHCFVLKQLLFKCVKSIGYLCSVAPNIVDVIKKELMEEACVIGSSHLKLSENHLESSSSLVYTKAIVQELMRHLALGLDFDLSVTERDGFVGDFDVKENSVIVLNHFAFSRSKYFHVNSEIDAERFRPSRFIKYDSSIQKYMFYNSEKLVTFQDQWHVLGLPRNFICRMLLLLLIKITFPEYVIDTKFDINLNTATQYELLYDMEKQFVWDFEDLRLH